MAQDEWIWPCPSEGFGSTVLLFGGCRRKVMTGKTIPLPSNLSTLRSNQSAICLPDSTLRSKCAMMALICDPLRRYLGESDFVQSLPRLKNFQNQSHRAAKSRTRVSRAASLRLYCHRLYLAFWFQCCLFRLLTSSFGSDVVMSQIMWNAQARLTM